MNEKLLSKIITIIVTVISVVCCIILIFQHIQNKSINTNKSSEDNANIQTTSESNYSSPVIPDGFKTVNTTNASWNNITTDYNKGLVIEDNYGNQFVWVPVDGINVKFEKNYKFPSIYKPSTLNTTDDTLSYGITDEKESVEKYGGFYIARYESMFDYNGGNLRAASKKSKNAIDTNDWSFSRNKDYDGYLWNYITYSDSRKYADIMAESYGYNTDKVMTNLVTGTQWDTTISWIKSSNNDLIYDNTWGNYIDSNDSAKINGYGKIQISGYSDNWSKNNIYDMAGNLWEWTNELYMYSEGVSRGASYIYSGINYPASYRTYNNSSKTFARIGFRIALYLK